MFAPLKSAVAALDAAIAKHEASFLAEIKPLVHDVASHVEGAAVATQVVVSKVADETGRGAEAANTDEAAKAAQDAADHSADALDAAELARMDAPAA